MWLCFFSDLFGDFLGIFVRDLFGDCGIWGLCVWGVVIFLFFSISLGIWDLGICFLRFVLGVGDLGIFFCEICLGVAFFSRELFGDLGIRALFFAICLGI